MLPSTIRTPKSNAIVIGDWIPTHEAGVSHTSVRSIDQVPVCTPIQLQATGLTSVELSMAQLLGLFQSSSIIDSFPLSIHKN